MIYDCLIIGAGVVGAFIARELSKYDIKTAVLERANDICSLQSKANSAIVHQGFDPVPGTLKARMNVEGARMFPHLCRDMGVPYKRCGALVVSRDKKDGMEKLKNLVDRAIKNAALPTYIVTGRRLNRLEHNFSENIDAALVAPFSAIVDPFLLTIRACEVAFQNAVNFFLNTEVIGFEKRDDGLWAVKSKRGEFIAKLVINAAGIHSDELNNMVSEKKYHLKAMRGDYMVLHKSQNGHVKHTIFSLPSKKGKGILVTPSTAGNILLGPTCYPIEDKEGNNVTQEGMDEIVSKTALNIKNIDYSRVIRTFAGVRSHEEGSDFVIGEAEGCENFINLIGIESPGLTAAPAIAQYVVNNFVSNSLELKSKPNFNSHIDEQRIFSELPERQQKKLIASNSLYKNIICKCESITEAEVVDAITRPLGATDTEGIKKRSRCMMGICQGGYCQRHLEDILEHYSKKDRGGI